MPNKKGRKIWYNGEELYVNDVVEAHNELIKMIAYRWLSLRKFDQIIERCDLEQELRLHLLKNLHTYKQEKGAALTSYIITLSKRYFINRLKVAKTNLFIKYGTNGQPKTKIKHINLYSKVEEDVLLCDTLSSKDDDDNPENNILYEECVKEIKERLNQTIYTPTGFIKKKRTFSRKVFDLLYNPPEIFTKFVRFESNCRVRAANGNHRKPATNCCYPSAEIVADFLEVNTRAVNISSKIIRNTIKRYWRKDEKTILRKRKNEEENS